MSSLEPHKHEEPNLTEFFVFMFFAILAGLGMGAFLVMVIEAIK